MKFKRITEAQAYEHIVKTTKDLRENGIINKEIREHPEIKNLNLDFNYCTSSGFGICGQGEYSGLVVTKGSNKYKVISIFIDTLCPEDTEIEDITSKLGKSDPEHPQCDIRKSIPMSILYYLEQFDTVPKKYEILL